MLDQSIPSGTGSTPPPIPTVKFHVAIDGKATGPFETAKIIEMINNGQINKDTLLWKQGTPSWSKASSFDELSSLFPPDIPL